MKIPEETICSIKTCKRIFCCENCRKKHERKTHAIAIKSQQIEKSFSDTNSETPDSLYVLCPICSNQPLLLHHEMYTEVLEHIKVKHLPLHCKNCVKIYTNIDELREFSKCVISSKTSERVNCSPDRERQQAPALQKDTVKIFESTELNTISTQTSPMLAGELISVASLRLNGRNQKYTQEASFSSLKNFSLTEDGSYNNRGSGIVLKTDTKGKLVRTTSTPVHNEAVYAKPKEQTFNASGAQVSSIYSSGCESEKNSLLSNGSVERPASLLTIPNQGDSLSTYRKLGGRPKVAEVTPLRQVMSKNIKKAFATHGLPSSYSDQKKNESKEVCAVLSHLPLDLRLSPALRRSQSDSYYGDEKVDHANAFKPATTLKPLKGPSSAKRISSSYFVIARSQKRSCEIVEEDFNSDSAVSSTSNSSVYKTCHSVEIITSTELSEVENVVGAAEANDQIRPLKNIYPQKSPRHYTAINTPITRLPGSNINKKLITFETPTVKNESYCEKFYTPKSSPNECSSSSKNFISKSSTGREFRKLSPMCRPSIRECAQSTAYSHYEIDYDSNDEVFLTPTTCTTKKVETSDQATQHGNGFIWSFMSSVMQKGSRFLDNKSLALKSDVKTKKSVIKRCSSIAGSLVRSNSMLDEKQIQSVKRKRTNTFDNQTSPLSTVRRMDSLPQHFEIFSSSKRFRIQGRKPIERMRNTSL